MEIYLFLFGPSCLGFLILLFTCIIARKLRFVLVGIIAAVVLHLLSVLVLVTCAGMGHAWGGSESSLPIRYCIIGFFVFAVPLILRLAFEAWRADTKNKVLQDHVAFQAAGTETQRTHIKI